MSHAGLDDTAVDLTGQVALVTGGGRGLIHAKDDEVALVRRAHEIVRDNLHVLSVRS
jgi:hypothetical protein